MSLWIPPNQRWVCLWQDEEGRFVVNQDGEFLCAESLKFGDKEVERKMRQAAKYYGIEGGRPVWQRGRKITKTEYETQVERLLAGKIPDEIEEVEAAIENIEAQKDGRS